MSVDGYQIACDEAGSEGENVTSAHHPVFVHASVDLTVTESEDILERLRSVAPSQATEFKSEHLLRAGGKGLPWLLSSGGPLDGRARAHLVDKDYFVVAKVVDLLVEEVAHAEGRDLYADREARRLAWILHRHGNRALGDKWKELILAFNSLMRIKQRKGSKVTIDEFFDTMDHVRLRARRKDVEKVLGVLWRARPHAHAFQMRLSDPDVTPDLDPLFASLPQTARAWYEIKRMPIQIIHDHQAALTPARVDSLIRTLASPLPEFRRMAPPVIVASIDLVDSKNDPRVQVADLLAGVSRVLASRSLSGQADSRVPMLRPFVDIDSVWSDDKSWFELTSRKAVGA